MPGGLKEGNVSCMLLTTWPGSVYTTYSKKGWRAANEEGLPPLAAADSPNVCSSRPAAVELAAAAARFLDAVGVGRLSTAQGTVDNVRAPLEAFTAADTILFRESAFVTCSRVSLSAAVPLNVASSSSVSGWAAGVVLLVLALPGRPRLTHWGTTDTSCAPEVVRYCCRAWPAAWGALAEQLRVPESAIATL